MPTALARTRADSFRYSCGRASYHATVRLTIAAACAAATLRGSSSSGGSTSSALVLPTTEITGTPSIAASAITCRV
eukprot:5016273-Prymnesium_polylepis.1